jgi:hypothetical protein
MRTRSVPGRALPALAGLALLIVTLAGCLRVDGDLSIEGDTISGTLLTALDKQAAELLELDPQDVFGTENAELTSLDGVTAEPYDDGTWAGSELTFDRVDIDELNQLSDGNPDGLRIMRDGTAGTYQLSMVLDFSWMSDLAEEQNPEQEVDLAQLMENFQATVAVTFPDEVTEHNGELSGTTVTWSPQPEERNEMRAVALGYQGEGDQPAPTASPGGAGDPSADPSDPAELGEPVAGAGSGDGSGPGWPLLVAVILLAVAAAAAAGWWFFLRPGRHPQPDSAPPTGSPPPEPGPDASPPPESGPAGNRPPDPDVG